MMTLWKWATRNSELCSTKSAGGTASSTPVMPPTTKVSMKATVHIIGSSNRMRPRYMVNSQLNSLAPVGIEITIVVIPKKLLTLAPDRSEEHTSELQSLMRISYAVFCLKNKNKTRERSYNTINQKYIN